MQQVPASQNDIIVQTSSELCTVIDFIRLAMTEFNQHDVYYGHGTENAWQESHVLVFSALHLPLDLSHHEQQVFYPCKLRDQEKTLLLEWIEARSTQGIPLPYLTSQAWFMQMPFYVDERVLIPRSPFAELIQKSFSPYLDDTQTISSVLDMCTGSACIAIALAHCFNDAQVDAVDIDADALEVASINIDEYQLQDRVFPIQSDLFENLGQQKYDLVVVNPPYVDAEDMSDLPREYNHEPEAALASGEDGLDLCLALLKQVHQHLHKNAWLFVEVGNSEVNFVERFGDFRVHWCELSEGGSGIFAIQEHSLAEQLAVLNKLK